MKSCSSRSVQVPLKLHWLKRCVHVLHVYLSMYMHVRSSRRYLAGAVLAQVMPKLHWFLFRLDSPAYGSKHGLVLIHQPRMSIIEECNVGAAMSMIEESIGNRTSIFLHATKSPTRAVAAQSMPHVPCTRCMARGWTPQAQLASHQLPANICLGKSPYGSAAGKSEEIRSSSRNSARSQRFRRPA